MVHVEDLDASLRFYEALGARVVRRSDDLDAVHDELREAGVEVVRPPEATGFGRQLEARTPDGLLVKINELGETLRGNDV
jgi:catechol 2,3-dioxygenase-like lactoylglutathione lyase family enzyme